jgi:hypothetical protein
MRKLPTLGGCRRCATHGYGTGIRRGVPVTGGGGRAEKNSLRWRQSAAASGRGESSSRAEVPCAGGDAMGSTDGGP